MTKQLEISPAVKLLIDARNLLETQGWCQSILEDEEQRHCIYGSLNLCEFGFSRWNIYLSSDDYDSAEAALFKVTGCSNMGALVTWNNDPSRTKEEVIAAFSQAIELLITGEKI